MEDITDGLKDLIKEKMNEHPSGRVFFPTSVIKKYRDEVGDYKTATTIIVGQMTDIANSSY